MRLSEFASTGMLIDNFYIKIAPWDKVIMGSIDNIKQDPKKSDSASKKPYK